MKLLPGPKVEELAKVALEHQVHVERMKWLAGLYYRDPLLTRIKKWLSNKLRIR